MPLDPDRKRVGFHSGHPPRAGYFLAHSDCAPALEASGDDPVVPVRQSADDLPAPAGDEAAE